MAQGSATLHYAIRPTVVGKYLGQLAFLLAILTLVPLGAYLYFNETGISWRYLQVIGGLLLVSMFTHLLPRSRNLQVNEALAIAAFAFLLAPMIMSYPMMASGLSWMDAMFEALSAVTTTGRPCTRRSRACRAPSCSPAPGCSGTAASASWCCRSPC